MKNSFLITLLLLAGYCFGQTEIESKEFNPEVLKQDVDYLFLKLESIHPSLYHYISKSKVDSARLFLERQLNQPMSRLEFAQKVIPVVSILKDGHTSLTFPQEERTTYLKNGGKVFPFDVLIRDNKLFVTNNYSNDSTIQKFTEILSINGIPTHELLNQLRPYISAELEFYRDIRVQNAFRRLLWYNFQFNDDYSLQLTLNGTSFNKTVSSVNEKEFMEAAKRNGASLTVKPYTYYTINQSIGVIDFRSMTNPEAFNRFVDSTFTVIQNEKTEYLVIDIRNNGGGNSALGDALFNYITDKPYRQVDRMEVKTSKEVKQNLRKRYLKWYMYPAYPFFVFSKQARMYLFKKNGTISVVENKILQKPKNPPNKFKGKTYLLTSHYTFSSANMLASAYKCFQMGTIVGEETGGVLTAFGDLIGITLPNTQLQAWCSHKKFIHPCSDGTSHGVKPDVEIIATQQDVQTGRDAAMEYVKQVIASKK
jgi:C-terminal processing protease CtpA/Prc